MLLDEDPAIQAAFAWARETRRTRAEFVARCAEGPGLERARDESQHANSSGVGGSGADLGSLRLLPILEAIPSVGGKVASRRALAVAGLSEASQLGDLDDAAWARLLAAVAPVGHGA